ERVEVGGEVSVHPVRLDERHRRRDAAEEELVRNRARRSGRGRRSGRREIRGGRGAAVLAVPAHALEQTREARQLLDELRVAALEERTPLARYRLGVLEVLLEDRRRVAGVQAIDFRHLSVFCSRACIPADLRVRTAAAG